jgi:hypothetical protein
VTMIWKRSLGESTGAYFIARYSFALVRSTRAGANLSRPYFSLLIDAGTRRFVRQIKNMPGPSEENALRPGIGGQLPPKN